jgi:UDP-N-acetylmuramoyl-tripeptide--D-alanyl-D-alanine ligase
MRFGLPEVAAAIGAEAAAVPPSLVTGWSIDSRTVAPGDLFFALMGPNHDGHSFAGEVLGKGAVAAVVDRQIGGAGPWLKVRDTLEGLQNLAAWARRKWGGSVIAVTGSAGKTTTKEIIASLLSVAMPVGKSAGNLNNHAGLPLSILRLPSEARAAALEIGMNHPGEIRQLAGIARPDIAVVTNAGHAHVEFFSSIEEVALAKRELIESLPPDGVAVLNADDPRVAAFREIHPGRSITFGLSAGAGVRADEVEYRPDGVRFRVDGSLWLESPMTGAHGVMNLLAGLAVARVFGIELGRLTEAVRSLESGRMRGRRFVHRGVTILDDCYNSNPEAAMRMLDQMREAPARRRIAVLGEMLELGRWSESLHREVGRHAVARGIDLLVGVRGDAAHMVDEAIRAGMPRGGAVFFEDPGRAGEFVRGEARDGDAILFKGSRGTQVEKALESFTK